jgi:phage shock protein A
MTEQEPLNAQLLRIIQDREDTIELLRDQIRAMNSELIRVKHKLKNMEERND